MNTKFSLPVSQQRKMEKGESTIGFALVAFLLFASLMMLIQISKMFFFEALVKASLNETLRIAEGSINLWGTEPEGKDQDTFADAVELLGQQFNLVGPAKTENLGLMKQKHSVGGRNVELSFAFLPPGYCAEDKEGNTICNSHVCDPQKTSASCQATICPKGSQESITISCNTWSDWEKKGATWGSCEMDGNGRAIKALCSQVDDGKKTYHEKLRNYPVELHASFDVSTPIGRFRRPVVVAGYPRVLIKEQVAEVQAPPICTGEWKEVRSCTPPTECGVKSAEGSITWVCDNGDCWCKEKPADGSYTCYSNNPYPENWECVWDKCSYSSDSCSGTQSCTPVCSDDNTNCCDPATRPKGQSRPCSQSGGSWTPGSWGTCELPQGDSCGSGSQKRSYTCSNPPCCSTKPPDETKPCEKPCTAECDTYVISYETLSNSYTLPGGQTFNSFTPTKLIPQCLGSWAKQYCEALPIDQGSSFLCKNNSNSPDCMSESEALQRSIIWDKTEKKHKATYSNWSRQIHWCYKSGVSTGADSYVDCSNNIIPLTDNRCKMLDVGDISRFFNTSIPSGLPAHCSDNVYQPEDRADCDAMFYFNENCEIVPATDNICNWIDWELTPLSLIFGELSDLNSGSVVVPFQMDPKKDQEQWVEWKASQNTPLLVFDPDQTGQVSSGYQLFGNWALGGVVETLEEAITHPRDRTNRAMWRNGYEALAIFDKDKDGSVTGNELSKLSLWFDNNRNALSEAGEVVSLESAGIIRLNYRNPIKQGPDLLLARGYERLKDGSVSNGYTVDWFIPTYSSKADAINTMFGKAQAMVGNRQPEDVEINASNPHEWMGKKLTIAKGPEDWGNSSNLNGIWMWTLEGDDNTDHPGLFFINERGGRIWGWSVVEVPARSRKTPNIDSARLALPLRGVRVLDEQGTPAVLLIVANSSGDTVAKSLVRLSEGGFLMAGSSEQVSLSLDGNKSSMVYRWKALRFQDKPLSKATEMGLGAT